MKNKKYILIFLFLTVFTITLSWGLWPFNFNATNGVDWLKSENGIALRVHGLVYGPGPSETNDIQEPPLFKRNESFSIEIWLTPGKDDGKGFSSIFGLYDADQNEIFSISQVKSSLNLSKYPNPANQKRPPHRWKWLKDALIAGKKRFITITSDKDKTTVYLDGKKDREYRNYSLVLAEELTPAWRVVIGNDPTGKKPWIGKVHGLAIYNHVLTLDKVAAHFESWQNHSIVSALKEEEIIALYPMNEQNGNSIQNAVSANYDLLIPDKFIILRKDFLKFYAINLKWTETNLRDVVINIVGFIPLGYCLLLVFNLYRQPRKRSVWGLIIPAVLTGVAVSLIIETLQIYLPTRYSSLADIITNTTGSGFGIILALLHLKLFQK